ncbi:Schizosaccharomyces specific protein Mug129 [Schizosaccharomyces osmophilus]|uniref:Schizosaccharomyces specific protein Mug129 n=1 Tax=Schizosaccharomyces osmophilus TaxID=2545709 RepID=A0AAF0AX75_9SCHI|nr:Schizosaccharomyces specific protein Mug129 [Schizosaccharomyces osmophilus]WBW73835.1 Schizosaccharomyces specific protein Mug129 [Schizosaccharomyces osmophilus]
MLWGLLYCCNRSKRRAHQGGLCLKEDEKPFSFPDTVKDRSSKNSRSSLSIEWTTEALQQFIYQYSARRNLSSEQSLSLSYFSQSYTQLFKHVYYSDSRSMTEADEAQAIVTFTIGSYLYKCTNPKSMFWKRLIEHMENIEDDGTCTDRQIEFRKKVASAQIGHPAFHFLPFQNKRSFHYIWSLFVSSYFMNAASVAPSPQQIAADDNGQRKTRRSTPREIKIREDVDVIREKFSQLLTECPDEFCENWLQRIYITCVLPKNHYIYILDESLDFLESIESMKQQIIRRKAAALG